MHPGLSAAQTALLVPEPGATIRASRGGDSQVFQIQSPVLGDTRQVEILLPSSYSRTGPDRKYPVLVVLDGSYLLPAVAVASDELSRNGQIPECVLVAIENEGAADELSANQRRVFDLTPPGLSVSGSDLQQGGDKFLDFIERDLLPALDRRFRTAPPRVLVGHSSGALLATYAAATRSAYAAVVSLDAPASLQEGWLATKLISRARAGGRPVRYASLETRFGWPQAAWDSLAAAAPAGWSIYREKLRLEGHETMQLVGAYAGLKEVFADFSRLSSPGSPAAAVLSYYARVSGSLGARVIPPRRTLAELIDQCLAEGKASMAREAYAALASGYGAPPDSATLRFRITEAGRRPAPTETVEGLLATPFPGPEEARGFIGEWVGDIGMGEGEPRDGSTRLRIRVEGGKVVGETVRRLPRGETSIKPWEYMRITPEGLTWGNMNGMSPRGVALFEGRLEGGTLSGSMRLGGLAPGTDTGPPLRFSFTRARK